MTGAGAAPWRRQRQPRRAGTVTGSKTLRTSGSGRVRRPTRMSSTRARFLDAASGVRSRGYAPYPLSHGGSPFRAEPDPESRPVPPQFGPGPRGGKIAGIFPIPIGPGSGKYSEFCPDSRFGRDFGKSGTESRFDRDRDRENRCRGIRVGDSGVWAELGDCVRSSVPASRALAQWRSWGPAVTRRGSPAA